MAKIGLLSTAHIHTRGFLQNLRDAGDGRGAFAIWDDVPERGRRYAAEFGTAFVEDLDALLAAPEAEGFIICAENTRHLPILEKALRAGRPVFCEKPLATTTKELKRIRALLAEHPVVLHSGYFLPFSQEMQAVAGLLRRDFLGKVTRVRFRNAHHAAYGRWFDNPDLAWFHDPELAGGGAFMDMGTHAVHALRTLFGPVERVWATIGNHSGIYPAVDDFGIAHLEFASGVLGTVETAWTQTGGVGGLEVTGSKLTLFHDGRGYQLRGPEFTQEPLYTGEAQAVATRVDRLVAVIRGQVPAEDLAADLAASLDAVAIVEACYKSAKSGRWIKVPAV